ncbi:Sulfotransferase domain protein [Botrimarina colliarenosi]|uniref:Sulfotransferase domain protein n=1 Tax=Botrimarina colliarenosi TaxID=2528001 RepID=A0A5C6ADW7_9BACT|nr:sulfotransferase domain-containing protein [Botrimarina colliarenosi]TWT97597.1 Sulfotransferase domain protein [Botrimarina colliarenosi]
MNADMIAAPSAAKPDPRNGSSHDSATQPRDPDFIIIGAMKAGTTTLYECFRRHPSLMMSEPKEPNYFSIDEVYNHGRDWYRNLFSGAAAGQLCGEASASYTRYPRFPETAQRLAFDLPNVKLIYILRNPVERFYSNYVFDTAFGGPRTLHETFEQRPYVLETSRYIHQIRHYLQYVPAANLHCLLLEDLQSDADAALGRLTSFLGVAPFEPGFKIERAFHRGQPQAARMGNRLLAVARKAPGAKLAARFLAPETRQAIRQAFRSSLPESSLGKWVVRRQLAQAEPLSDAIRRQLHDELDGSTRELESFLGRDLSHWCWKA